MMRHKKTIHGFQESDREEEQSDEQSEDVRSTGDFASNPSL